MATVESDAEVMVKGHSMKLRHRPTGATQLMLLKVVCESAEDAADRFPGIKGVRTSRTRNTLGQLKEFSSLLLFAGVQHLLERFPEFANFVSICLC